MTSPHPSPEEKLREELREILETHDYSPQKVLWINLLELIDREKRKAVEELSRLQAENARYRKHLQEITTHAADAEEAPLTTARHLITIAHTALSE